MRNSLATSSVVDESAPNEPTTIRLTIRAEILPNEIPPDALPPSSRRSFVWLIVGVAILVAVAWILIRAFTNGSSETAGRSDVSPPATTQASPNAPPVTIEQPPPAPAAEASTAVISEIVPKASPGALQTIRGTVRVAIRVTISKDGSVVATASEVPGPSKYFERVSIEAAKGWKFTPTRSNDSRSMLLRFEFTRYGVTGRAAPEH